MPNISDLPEIITGKEAAKVIGKSVGWLWRRKDTPIYSPSPTGRYFRRQMELIVDVESGVFSPEQAYSILRAERDAKRAQGELAISKARKLNEKRDRSASK